MSAIDSFSHAHVANFFELPIYWILEEGEMGDLTNFLNDNDEKINKYFLSIGGGSGEHPALIINNDAVLFNFLNKINLNEKDDGNEFDYKLFQLIEKIKDKYFDKDDIYYWSINKNQWGLKTFIRIAKGFEEKTKNEIPLEDKIMDAMALFIINEMPLDECIKDEDLIEFAKMVKSNYWKNIFDWEELNEKFYGLSGVMNCQKNGKIIKDGKVVWGYSLNDWFTENKT